MSTTYAQWFDDLLDALGIAPNQADLAGLASVVHEEGANTYNNPFNIESHGSTPWTGAGDFNSVGVQEYASPTAGLDATVAFLKDNSGWDQLLDALRSDNTDAVNQAFANIYTWAPFHAATAAQATDILASSMSAGTIASTGTTASGSASDADYTATPASDWWNPLNWPGNVLKGLAGSAGSAAESALGPIVGAVANWALKLGIVVGGLGLVIVGLYRASEPARQSAAQQVEQVAPLAAMAG